MHSAQRSLQASAVKRPLAPGQLGGSLGSLQSEGSPLKRQRRPQPRLHRGGQGEAAAAQPQGAVPFRRQAAGSCAGSGCSDIHGNTRQVRCACGNYMCIAALCLAETCRCSATTTMSAARVPHCTQQTCSLNPAQHHNVYSLQCHPTSFRLLTINAHVLLLASTTTVPVHGRPQRQ